MFGALPNKTKQFFLFVIKISIVIGSGYFIYNKIVNNKQIDFYVFWDFLSKNEVFLIKNALFLLVFSFFNWFFEILKWQKLASVVHPVTYGNSMKQSLAALTASFLTPNRIGDYAAKVSYYPRSLRKRVLVLNLFSHMSQMLATVVMGLIGLFYFTSEYGVDLPLFKVARIAAIVVMVMAVSIFTSGKIKYSIRGIPLDKLVSFLRELPARTKILAIVLSFTRYFIFSAQFVWLLLLFGVEVSYFQAMIIITTLYMISSLIPTFMITDAIVKGSIALYLFNLAGVNDLTVLSIISLMWILNFALPAILGSFFLLSYKMSFNPIGQS